MISARPRLLVLANKLPYPPDSGDKIRLFNFLKGLSANWQIDLLAIVRDDSEAAVANELQGICETARTITFRPHVPTRWQKYIRLLLDPHPAYGYYTRALSNAIQAAISAFDYPAILVSGLPVAQFIPPGAVRRKTVYDHVDAYYVNIRDTARTIRFPARLYFYIQTVKYKRYERQLAENYFRQFVVVSEADSDAIRALSPQAHVSLVPNGVDTQYFQPMDSEIDPYQLVFTGTMSYWPNVDAMQYFCREIMPIVWATMPQARLSIVGHSPLPDMLALASDRITVTGRVPDIRPHIASGSIYIAPFRIGTGTHLKVLEAMAMCKAVVATSRGMQGLGAGPGRTIEVGDTPEAFAAHVVRLLRDAQARQSLGQAARSFVLAHHDWARYSQMMNALLQQAAQPAFEQRL